MLFTHPMADAAGAGFLVTALNLSRGPARRRADRLRALRAATICAIGKATGLGVAPLRRRLVLVELPGYRRRAFAALASSLNWFVWAG